MPQMDNEILYNFHLKHNIEALFVYSLGGDKILHKPQQYRGWNDVVSRFWGRNR